MEYVALREDFMGSALGTVYVVDDDDGIRRALARVLDAAGFRPLPFGSAAEFLAADDPTVTGCIVLDVSLPDFDGLHVQQRLSETGRERPIVFISAFASIPISVRAMRAGAVTFLSKPVPERELIPAVFEAIALDRRWRRDREERVQARVRLDSLTPREREVMEHIIAGLLNKQIAAALGTVEQTVKVHRARVMKKMGARSVAHLVRVAAVATSRARRTPVYDSPSDDCAL